MFSLSGSPEASERRQSGEALSRGLGREWSVALGDAGAPVGLLASVLDGVPIAVLLVEPTLRVLHANPEARRLLEASDGLQLAAGILKLGREEALELRVRKALAGDRDALDSLARPVHLHRPSGRRPYEVSLAPRAEATPGVLPLSVAPGALFVRDPDRGVELSVLALRRRYSLTPSEARTALSVLAGGGMDQVAARLGLRPMTVRGYLRQVFDKTGARSQVDLVRLLLAGELVLPLSEVGEP